VGLGISNLPLVRFLASHGVRVSGRDRKSREALGESARELEALGVSLILGEDYLEGITEDVIFRSPGIRPDLPPFEKAMARGAVMTSEMELFLELTPATVIGITGSDGKTTTTTLTHRILSEEEALHPTGRRIYVGGNIGAPLLPLVEEMRETDVAVLELSSFQLQTMRQSAHRAALTNLTPNHLNWHTDLTEYADAKCNLFRHGENRFAVINAENEGAVAAAKTVAGETVWMSSAAESHAAAVRHGNLTDRAVFMRDGWILRSDGGQEEAVLEVSRILLPGRHNLENYMTAIALTAGMASQEAIARVAESFTGVAHRFQRVAEIDGVTYYNSSIDSSPSRTAVTLTLLSTRPILICGGSDKGLSMEPLAQAVAKHCRAVVLTGETAPKIRAALEQTAVMQRGELPLYEEATFEGALKRARAVAKRGDVVLLSPACASFDAFPNFEVRGETFCRIVRGFADASARE
jgi:UDP-N-acetylmuramoylalanine--D-glutamate ligase